MKRCYYYPYGGEKYYYIDSDELTADKFVRLFVWFIRYPKMEEDGYGTATPADFQHYLAHCLGLIDEDAGEVFHGGSRSFLPWTDLRDVPIPRVLRPLVTFGNDTRRARLEDISQSFIGKFNAYIANNGVLGERERAEARAEFVIGFMPKLRFLFDLYDPRQYRES